MNLLLTLAFAASLAGAPIPEAPKGQSIDIAKSFELGVLAESFGLISAEYHFDKDRSNGVLTIKLEAKKDVDVATLRTNGAGFFDDDNTLQLLTAVRPSMAFPLQKGERLVFSIPTGPEDKKWNRIAIRKVDMTPSSSFGGTSPGRTTPGGFGGGAGGGRGRDVVPPQPNPFDPIDR